MNPEKECEEANMLYRELHNVIRRWINESDKLTNFQVLGTLEAVKQDVLDAMGRMNDEN